MILRLQKDEFTPIKHLPIILECQESYQVRIFLLIYRG